MSKFTPEQIVDILNSVSRLSIEDGELDAFFNASEEPMGINEFIPNSFTRQLLELIERHLLDEQDTGSSDSGLGEEQEENSGSSQPNQEANQEVPEAGEAFRNATSNGAGT